MNGTPLLEVREVRKFFPISSGLFKPPTLVRAVDGVSFAIQPRESFGLVGESGCGKTTLGKLVLALEKPTSGHVLFEGRDLAALPAAELRRTRRRIQVIFQDPYSSLNPRMTVADIVSEPWDIHGLHKNPSERARRLGKLFNDCGISRSLRERHPHALSGGQRQRVGIARALALEPRLVVADEPVSALDLSVQAQILNLLKDLQAEHELAYLFISHDFSVVRHLCSRLAVMYLGRIVETADSEALFRDPQHPYTEALLSAAPVADPEIERRRRRVILAGDVPSPARPPSGCHFHPRCLYRVDDCRLRDPALAEAKPGRLAACPVLPFRDKPSDAALRVPRS